MCSFTDANLEQSENRNIKKIDEFLAKFVMPAILTIPFALTGLSFGEIGLQGISDVWLRRDGGDKEVWEARMTVAMFGGTQGGLHGNEPFHEFCHENSVRGRGASPRVAIAVMYRDAESTSKTLW